MKKQQYFGLFLLSIAVIAIAVPVVAAESRFLAGAQEYFDRRCTRDRVSSSTSFDCYLFEQVQSLLNRVATLEQTLQTLTQQIADIQLIPGPRGEQVLKGDKG